LLQGWQYELKLPLGIGVIGLGFIGREHIYALTTLAQEGAIPVKITAICDTNISRLNAAQQEYEVGTIHKNYKELIDDTNVDVIYICTPTKWHPEIVEASVAAGKPFFCEKPLATDFTKVKHLYKMVEKSKIPAQVGLVLRFTPQFLYLHRLHRENNYGKLIGINFCDDQQFPIGDFYGSKWRVDPDIAGSGVLLEHSIHDVDIIRWLYGDVSSVYADITTIGDYPVEDQATTILHMKSGAVCTLTTLWHNIFRPSDRSLQIFYEDAYIELAFETFGQHLSIQHGEKPPYVVPEEELYKLAVKDLSLAGEITPNQTISLVRKGKSGQFAQAWRFIQNLIESSPCSPDFQEGYYAHELVEAAYISSKRRTPISLPL
jgi:predicted dehydrogenase